MTDLLKWVNELEAFLKSQSTSSNPIVDSTTAQNMLQSIATIKQQFGSDWGNASAMATDMQKWVNQTTTGTPSFAPQLNALQNAVQTLNQSVSGFSTVLNTLMQQGAQWYQQMMAAVGMFIQGYEDLISSSVKRQIAQ
jgi:ABC-type transporter Mla subunit MlaD